MIFETTQSDLVRYNGLKIVESQPLDESKYDKADVGKMFAIKLENGAVLQAFADEMVEEEDVYSAQN